MKKLRLFEKAYLLVFAILPILWWLITSLLQSLINNDFVTNFGFPPYTWIFFISLLVFTFIALQSLCFVLDNPHTTVVFIVYIVWIVVSILLLIATLAMVYRFNINILVSAQAWYFNNTRDFLSFPTLLLNFYTFVLLRKRNSIGNSTQFAPERGLGCKSTKR